MDDKIYLCYLIGTIVAVVGFYNLIKCLARRKWPETIGKIQRNETRKITSSIIGPLRTDLMSAFSSKSYAGTGKEIVLALSFVYAVDGYKYIGSNLYSAPVLKERNQLGGVYEGDKVKVFYKPSDPSVSFLAHSFAWPSLLVVIVGGLIVSYAYYLQLYP